MLPLIGCGYIICLEVACLVFVSFGKLKYFPYDLVNKPFLWPPLSCISFESSIYLFFYATLLKAVNQE